MLFLCYSKCSTCKKAKKFLENNKINFKERNIKDDNPTYEELKEWYYISQKPLKKFFNTSGILYKEMNLKDKYNKMSDDELLKLLSTNGMLVKRPILKTKNFVLIGFNEDEWKEKLLRNK